MPRHEGRLTRIMAVCEVSCSVPGTLYGRGSVQGGEVRGRPGGDGELQGGLRYRVVVALGGGRGRESLGLLLGLSLHGLHWKGLYIGSRGGLGFINTGVSTAVKTTETIAGTI